MEEERQLKHIRSVQTGWSGFLWRRLELLSYYLDRHDYYEAARVLGTLKRFLPNDVKAALDREFQEVESVNRLFVEIDKAVLGNSQKTPFQASLALYRARVLKNRVAERVVCSVVEKLTAILDSKGYLELRSPIPTRVGSIEKIGERLMG
ncbi:MAG: hypothetical protein QXT28_06945 [Thermofilaceae archaeon]